VGIVQAAEEEIEEEEEEEEEEEIEEAEEEEEEIEELLQHVAMAVEIGVEEEVVVSNPFNSFSFTMQPGWWQFPSCT
jgi:hypothetical protein